MKMKTTLIIAPSGSGKTFYSRSNEIGRDLDDLWEVANAYRQLKMAFGADWWKNPEHSPLKKKLLDQVTLPPGLWFTAEWRFGWRYPSIYVIVSDELLSERSQERRLRTGGQPSYTLEQAHSYNEFMRDIARKQNAVVVSSFESAIDIAKNR
jgi:hypothetical protein